MSVEGMVQRAQQAAERLMQDACIVQRVTGETTGAGGVITPTYSTLYTGRCRVQVRSAAAAAADVGEAYRLIARHEVQLPMSVTGLREGDRITLTASLDPELVGRVYVVRDVTAKTHASARRVGVVLVTS